MYSREDGEDSDRFSHAFNRPTFGLCSDDSEEWSLVTSLGLSGSPCAIRSRQVAHAKAVLAQNSRRDVGALAALAIRDDFAVAR